MFLVTGASGFLGVPLVQRLAGSGARVRALARKTPLGLPAGVETAIGDLADAPALGRAVSGCETVFHLAGKAHDLAGGPAADAEHRRVNVEGTRALLAAAAAAGVARLVFFSSVKAMGEGGDLFLDETAAATPATAYGRSKREAEELVLEAGTRTGMRVAVLRLPLVYGPGAKGNLSAMLAAIARGTFPPPPRVANRRSLASVEDAINAALLAASRPEAAGRTYLVTDGEVYSTRGIYDAMRAALGKPPVHWSIPLPALGLAASTSDAAARVFGRSLPFGRDALDKLLGSAWYSNERIRRELGFVPATTLAASLPAMAMAQGLRP